MTHTIRKWRIGDVPLCPSLLWKEVDVELGRVFRGKDFNLERRGLVRDPTQMGRWKPVRNKGLPARRHEHRTPHFQNAVMKRSPALGRCLKEERNLTLSLSLSLTLLGDSRTSATDREAGPIGRHDPSKRHCGGCF